MGTAINLNQLAESASAATKGMFPSSFLLFLVIGERLLDQLSCRLLRDADILVGSQLLGEQLSTMIPIFFADQFDNVIPELFRYPKTASMARIAVNQRSLSAFAPGFDASLEGAFLQAAASDSLHSSETIAIVMDAVLIDLFMISPCDGADHEEQIARANRN